MRRWRSLALPAGVLFVLFACARHHHAGPPEVEAEPGSGEIAVRVESHNFADVVIYLDLNGSRFRLGLAGGERSTVFFVPWRRVATTGRIQLIGDPIGGTSVVTTGELAVRPGSMVVWTLESPLSRSFAAVY